MACVMVPVDAVDVAPCAGAWIETLFQCGYRGKNLSPPARGRGLKLMVSMSVLGMARRPLRGGVD